MARHAFLPLTFSLFAGLAAAAPMPPHVATILRMALAQRGPAAVDPRFVARSWRSRIRRVVYDVGMETGAWSLQQGADWCAQTRPARRPYRPRSCAR
jgi:hypothetical protein